jgi:serine protease Do
MNHRIFALFLACIWVVHSTTAKSQEMPQDLQKIVDQAISKVKPSLVRIHVVSANYREGREYKYQSSGSGAIITPEGHVITNHHVAGNATRLVCTLSSREEVDAILIGTDPLSDIAIIKLTPEDDRVFPTVKFADSDSVQVGDRVLALGSPMALSQSVTMGIISNNAMIMPKRMGGGSLQLDGEDVGSLVRWFAHDAAIYGGNSGGPLVNLEGDIIGINEISIGLAGAIPGNLARSVMDAIIETGKVSRCWLGFYVQPLLKHGDNESGVFITGSIEGSPADKAGIQSGDIMLEINGIPTHVSFEEDIPILNGILSDLPIDEALPVKLLRGKEKIDLEIVGIERERRLPDQFEIKEWGIAARDLSYLLSKEYKREDRHGVLVTSLQPGGPGNDAKPPLVRRDIITKINDQPINSVQELKAWTDEAMKDRSDPYPVLITFERRSQEMVTVVKVGVKDIPEPGLEIRKAWLPVVTQVITKDIAEVLGNKDLKGFRITKVFEDSTADTAGLQVGDLILDVDGEKLSATNLEDIDELPALIRNYRAGTETELGIQRESERLKVSVELIKTPKANREMPKFRDDYFEFTARDITFFDDSEERWGGEQTGVRITEVKPGGWAALGLLKVGDLVQFVDGESVQDVATLEQFMEELSKQKPESVVFQVLRGIYTVFIELEPQWLP